MKGPGIRYDIDIRRVWECPTCGNRVKGPGDVTSRRCSCESQSWMRLIEQQARREFPIREKIVLPEEESVDSDATENLESESDEHSMVSKKNQPEHESSSSAADQNRNRKRKEKQKKGQSGEGRTSARQVDSEQASVEQDHSTGKLKSPKSEADSFGDNIFDD